MHSRLLKVLQVGICSSSLCADITDTDIRNALGGRLEDDPIRLHFNKVMERANTQVLRLSRWHNEDILWANGGTVLPLDKVPCCEYCGAERKFEFQIMPQLIYLLGQNQEEKTDYPEIDFGSLIIFTCCASCEHIHPFVLLRFFNMYQRAVGPIQRNMGFSILITLKRILKR